jgi:transposase
MFNNSITDIQHIVQTLLEQIKTLTKELLLSRKEIAELREKLSRYEHPKTSSNSSLPPSKDPIGKRKINLRKPSNRPSGGQKGHKGTTLKFQTPDKIEELSPHYCIRCGKSLSDIEGQVVEIRQQTDIPPILPIITQYQSVRKVCSCGCASQGSFPQGVTPFAGYGFNAQVLVCYLSVCQQIPFKRLTVLLNEFFHLSISQGTVQNILERFEQRTSPAYQTILQMLSHEPVVGVDETSTNINGKNHWSWVFQNHKATYITSARSRSIKEFTDIMLQGMPNTTLVSDCYSGYFSQDVADHQICTAHLLRDTLYLSELYPTNQWAEKFSKLITDALHLRRTTSGVIDDTPFTQRLNILLNQKIDNEFPKIITFQKRIEKYKHYLFGFLRNELIPSDNNASERAFRVFKIKLKVSGFFKSPAGSQRFAQLHSIVDTARKNLQSPYDVLRTATLC